MAGGGNTEPAHKVSGSGENSQVTAGALAPVRLQKAGVIFMVATRRPAGYMRNKRMLDNLAGYAFLAPAMVGYILFIFGPILLSVILSLFNYNLIQTPKFLGLGNFQRLLKDSLVSNSFANTFKFLAILVPIHCVLGLILAFMVSRARRLQSAYRTSIYFPSIVTTASVTIAWAYLFSTDTGVINYFLRLLGGGNVKWLTAPTMAYVTLALFSFWKFIGTTFLYYYIGLKNIPESYYEAAQIDGASTIRTFFSVTLPLLTPTAFFVVVTNVIGVFQIFDEPFLLTSGGPGSATRTVALEIYERAFLQTKIGYGASISFTLFLIILAVTILQFVGQKKWVNYDYE